MVRRTTFIVIVVFALLVGFAWILQRYQANKSEVTATMTPTPTIAYLFNLNGKQVDHISIADSSGNKIEFYLDSSTGIWAIKDLPSEQADSVQIESIAAQIINLQADESLSQPPPLESMGLDKPAYTLSMLTSDGGQLATRVGSLTPIGKGYYVSVGSNTIVIVDKSVREGILAVLTAPPLVTTATPEIIATEIESPTQNIMIGTPAP
jgi:hypothetical protein